MGNGKDLTEKGKGKTSAQFNTDFYKVKTAKYI